MGGECFILLTHTITQLSFRQEKFLRKGELYIYSVNYRRGDVIVVDFDPVVRPELGGVQLAVVIQNNMGNNASPVTTVAPLLPGRVRKGVPSHIPLVFHDKKYTVCLEQLRCISYYRISEKKGVIVPKDMKRISARLSKELGIGPDAKVNPEVYGQVYYVDFDPIFLLEQAGLRPAVVVQADKHGDTVMIAPLTSASKRTLVTHVASSFQGKPNVVITEQVRTVATKRLNAHVGSLPEETMSKVTEALGKSLGLISLYEHKEGN